VHSVINNSVSLKNVDVASVDKDILQDIDIYKMYSGIEVKKLMEMINNSNKRELHLENKPLQQPSRITQPKLSHLSSLPLVSRPRKTNKIDRRTSRTSWTTMMTLE
jgi:hypothetical protein